MGTGPTMSSAPPQLQGVFLRLRPQMAQLDRFLSAQLSSFEPEIRQMAEYCIDTSGKRIRPALVFLSGWTGSEKFSADLVRVAAVVELVHLATLVHDDIMDGAEVRRNRHTAVREYGPAASVLLGDALFAHALHLAAQYPTAEVCAAVADSTRRVCAGEIVQTLHRRSTQITRAEYWRVIELKTAELFRVSCFLGARLGGYEPGFVLAATAFGRHLGLAYQVYDDLADFFGDPQRIGKTLGTDLSSGKITLPLLVLSDRLPAGDRELLEEEIAGRRPAQAAARLKQMEALDVFGAVGDAIFSELRAAELALEPWNSEAPTALLRDLVAILREQVTALSPRRLSS